MTKFDLIESMLIIRNDSFGKITEIINNPCDYESINKKFRQQNIPQKDIEKIIQETYLSGEIEVEFRENKPFEAFVTDLGKEFYINESMRRPIGFRA